MACLDTFLCYTVKVPENANRIFKGKPNLVGFSVFHRHRGGVHETTSIKRLQYFRFPVDSSVEISTLTSWPFSSSPNPWTVGELECAEVIGNSSAGLSI